jgi:hypothetical protein
VRPDALGVAGAILVWALHGVGMGFLVPIGSLVWMVTLQGVGRKRMSLLAFLHWLDNNLTFVLVCGPLSPLFPTARVKWIPASERFGVNRLP